LIPNLVLQPLVENAVKHGLSRKVGPGTLRIAARLDDGVLTLVVGDDGLGMSSTVLADVFERGVGLRNLRARLERLYGPAHLPEITSTPGGGSPARGRMMQAIRALVVDDEKLARDRLIGFLGKVPGVEVVGQATNGVEAVESIERDKPDLVF